MFHHTFLFHHCLLLNSIFGASGTYVLEEMDFLEPNTPDDLMLFGTDMCNLGSMTRLGNFGGFYLGRTTSSKLLLQG
jgi:hypothetical protein